MVVGGVWGWGFWVGGVVRGGGGVVGGVGVGFCFCVVRVRCFGLLLEASGFRFALNFVS